MAYESPEESAESEAGEPEVGLPPLETFIEWYDTWEERTRKDRELMARDYAYYDGDQWTAEDIKDLEERGQPVLTKNRIARKVNFVLGDEAEKGVDPIARPKTPAHEDDARAATDGLRATEETQDFDAVRSSVFKDMLISGIAGAVVEGDPDPEAVTCAPLTHIQWDRLWWDPHSSSPDVTDAKYKGLVVWQDLDDSISDYPEAEDVLRQAVNEDQSSGDSDDDKPKRWADKKRKRVKIAECYFRVGAQYYRACFTKGAFLRKPELTGYLDDTGKLNVCPLVMASCYVRSSDNGRYGVVRALISPQDEVNKRDSKALHLLSVNGVIVERDAVTDPQKFMTELAKADGYAEVEPGRLTDGSIKIREGGQLAAPHIQLSQQARADIDGIGPSSANMPDVPESSSGRAFIARQKAAAKELAPVFASLRRWDLEVLRQDWMRICQFRTEEWWLRVTDDQELTGYRFIALNRQMTRADRMRELLEKGVPAKKALETAAGNWAMTVAFESQQQIQAVQAQQAQMAQAQGQPPPPQDPEQMAQAMLSHPLMQEEITANQAAKMRVDIIIDTASESAILEDEEFETVASMLPQLAPLRPDLVPTLVKVLVKASHLRSKQEILQMLDKPPDPQQAKQQQEQQQMQMAGAKAGISVQETQAQLNAAKAAQAQAEAQAAGPLAQADIQAKQAKALHDGASAGEKAGGPPQQLPTGAM